MSESSTFDINTVIDTAKKVITQPGDFYQNMPKQGGYSEPLIFVVVMGAIAGLIGAVFSLFVTGHVGAMTLGLGSLIFVPIMVAIGSFISAAIMFVVWKLMGTQENYETAYRCIAYSCAIFPITLFVSFIPYLGTITVLAWGLWLIYIASIHVHKLDRQKSMIVLAVLGVILLFMNLSGERYQRQHVSRYAQFNEQMSEMQNELENMTPEELGEATGKFLKGLKQAAEQDAQE